MSDLARYFFDVDTGKAPYVDEYGVELASVEEAHLEAYGLVVSLIRDSKDFDNNCSTSIRVSNSDRKAIYELRFSISGRVLNDAENETAT